MASLGEASISLPPIRSPGQPAQAQPLLSELVPPSSPPPPAEEPFDPTALIEVGEYEYDPDWYAQDEENARPTTQQQKARAVTAESVKPAAAKPLPRKPKKRIKQLTRRRGSVASNVTAPMRTLPEITAPGLKSATAAVVAAQKLKAAPAKKKIKDYSNKCRDMRGKSYDLKKLRAKKQKAIIKGMKYMKEFLRKNKYAALYKVGDDAACIFFEIWYTSQDQNIRCIAKDIAKEMLRVYERKLLRTLQESKENTGDAGWGTGDFFSILYMLRCKHEMGLPCDDLLTAADAMWVELGLKDTSVLFGYEKTELAGIATDPWIDLLLCILIMEMMKILFNNRFPIEWGMAEALTELKKHQMTPPPMDAAQHFHDSFYLATHTVYAINAYQSIPTHQRDAPWLYKYIRVALNYWMKMAWRGDRPRLKPKKKNKHGIDEVVDIDGVGEAVDVLRGVGMTEGNDCLLTEATQYLLKTQNKDGSWPATFHDPNSGKEPKKKKSKRETEDGELHPYDELHPTWVATQALRDRDYKISRPGNVAWAAFIARTMKKVKFHELEYDAKWMK